MNKEAEHYRLNFTHFLSKFRIGFKYLHFEKNYIKVTFNTKGGQLSSAGHIAPLYGSRGPGFSQKTNFKAKILPFAGRMLPPPGIHTGTCPQLFTNGDI
jgi:hypothetical protein